MPSLYRRCVGPLCGLAAALLSVAVAAQSPPADVPPPPTRGELLYITHCITCHSQQMHWRDKRLAADWASLKLQVALWQERALLGWTGDDITQVSAYLNDSIYRYPRAETAGAPPWPALARGR